MSRSLVGFIQPRFIHGFGKPEGPHTYRGSLNRHKAVERVIYAYQRLRNWIGDALPGDDLLKVPEILTFGFNCGFPARDIALYVIWYLRGCQRELIWEDEERFSLKDG